MASPTPVKVDPKELKRAESLWHNFGVATKWGTIAVIVTLVALAIATL